MKNPIKSIIYILLIIQTIYSSEIFNEENFNLATLVNLIGEENSETSGGFNVINSLKIFETPDLSIDYSSDGNVVHIDAYKSTKNDKIFALKDPSQYEALKWVSIGSPRLTEVALLSNSNLTSMFHFYRNYFVVYFEMLTQRDKQVLKQEVKRTKNIDVSTASFINIKPSELNCTTFFYDSNDESIVLEGN